MAENAPKRKPFKKQIYRGIELDKLLELNTEQVVALFRSRQRRRFRHGIHPKYDRLIKKIKQAVKVTPHGEKPKAVKTHLRDAIIMPEMVGGIAECYSGKYWTPVEIKWDLIWAPSVFQLNIIWTPIESNSLSCGFQSHPSGFQWHPNGIPLI